MSQNTQPSAYGDQTPPSDSYNQPSYQAYQPPSGYQPGYNYQPPVASPPKKGLSGCAWTFVGLSLVTICVIVFIGLVISSAKTNVAAPAIASSSTLLPTSALPTLKNSVVARATTTPSNTSATTGTTNVSTSIVTSDWTSYEPANAGFSLSLPSSWQPLDQDTVKAFLNVGIKELQNKNPQISSSLTTQVKTVFASGYIKFFGFDSLATTGFATNVNVLKQAVGTSTTLDAYVKLNLSQLGNTLKLEKPVQQTKVSLIVGDAVQLQYQWDLTVPATGKPVNITLTQYILIHDKNAYVVTFTGLTDELDQNLPLFTQIIETFRLTN